MKPILILIACIITLSSCKNDTEQETESTQEVINHSVILTSAQFQNAHIQTGKLMQKNISTLLNLNGKIVLFDVTVSVSWLISLCFFR